MTKFKMTIRQFIISLHVLIWGTLLWLPWFLRTPAQPHDLIGPLPAGFYMVATLLHIMLFYGNSFFLYPKLCNKKNWGFYLLCFIAAVAAVNYIKMMILHTWFPGQKIYGPQAGFIFAPTLMAMVAGTVYRYVVNRIIAEKQQRERQAEQLTMELKFLRSQISPHFLFNVLTNLVSLARKKSDLLEPLLIMLSDLMRYMLYDSDDQKVTLEKEVEYLKNYIALQQMRFGGDVVIQTSMHLPDNATGYRIEPMLLIPFVENAFKHGVGWIKDPEIYIGLQIEMQQLDFQVKNNFNAGDRQHKDTDSGIGLTNVKTRLQLLYPRRHRLTISEEKDTFHVHLTLELQ